MIRALRALLLALLVSLLPLSPAVARDTLRVGLQLEPPNLDPTSGAAEAIDQVASATIYESLVRLNAEGAVKPLLATSWTVSADGLRYDLQLRDGVRFHDSEPFDAAAVVFSLRRAIAPASTNAQRDALANIRTVEATGPLAVRILLRQHDADFLRLLSYGDAAMVPPRAAATLATHPIGTGPFRFRVWQRGDAITLERNPIYWGSAARLRTLRFRFIGDPTAAYAAMRAHDLDLFIDYPAPETIAALRQDPSLAINIGPTEGEVIVAMNERAGPLADVRVRRALARAIDRRAIIDGAMYGYGTPIGSHFPPQSPDYLDLTGLYRFDPAESRRELAAAGYPNGFALTLKLPPPIYARRGGEIIAAQLGAIGVRVTIENIEWAQWLDAVFARHDFQLTIVNHAEPFDYDIYGRPDYYFGYHSARIAGLLHQLKLTSDPAQRSALLHAVQRGIAEDAPNLFLFEYPRLGVQDATLRDLWVNTPNQPVDYTSAHFAGSAGDATAEDGVAGGGWHSGAILVALAVLGLALMTWTLGPGFVARRIAALAATLLVASLLIFALVQIAPGDPAAFMMGLDASPQAIAALHDQLGLTGPVPLRYLHWLGGLLHGEFGTSYTYRVDVGSLIGERLAVSLPLAGIATLLSILIGIPTGYLMVRYRGGALDRLLGAAARIGVAIPSFCLAILLVLLFSVTLHWFQSGGFPGWDAGVAAGVRALALPSLALAIPQAAILARVTRAALLDELGRDYIRTARAKGLSAGAALRRHALPNAIGPVITVLGLQVPFLIAGSAIIEMVFFLPGIGRLMLQAISQRDLIVVQSVVVILVATTVLASFAVDVIQLARDPRLRSHA